ncbi:MAG TPA: M1 family aminopeptidase [Blastocatellia bacterium]|nr:M1 family aminopeptidase [Blastocatellia bacterium]
MHPLNSPNKQTRPGRLCLGALFCLFALVPPAGAGESRREKPVKYDPAGLPQRYQITIDIDYRAASFTGHEVVRFVNSNRTEVDSVSFHLYPNVGLGEDAEPWLALERVSSGERELKFSLKSRGTLVRVQLPAKLAPGQSLELRLEFSGRVPKVQREETSLLAHFLQEVNDAVSDERLQRDARDMFFASEQAMLLGYFYPMLATRAALSTEQGLAAGVSGIVLSDVADYDVTVRVDDGLTVISSAEGQGRKITAPTEAAAKNRSEYVFRGERLRGFAIALGEKLQSVEKRVGQTRVVSYFREGDERLGQQMLGVAVGAVETYNKAFGEYPYPLLSVVEVPLTAGYSGIEFPGLAALAQAYYIDFNAPEAKRLPDLLREQADVIKSAIEFTLAHCVAHQWWGGVVGSDPQRNPWLDEALANYAAAYYYEAVYGRAAGDEAIERQLRGVYHAYRMLGGTDQEVDKPAKDFHSFIQYSAIVQAKGALMLAGLRRRLGDEQFFNTLRYYYSNRKFQIASPHHLRYAMLASAEDHQVIRDLFQRWLKEKHGDEDIGVPEMALFTPQGSKKRSLGRFFGRIGRAAARPF